MGVASLEQFIIIPVAKLVRAEWNYKQSDEELADKLVSNIQRNGQVENIIVRELTDGKFEIVNGNHRYDALLKIGAENAIAYNMGNVSAAEAKRLSIETNETKFPTNDASLGVLLKELAGAYRLEDLITTMPYNEEELTAYIKALEFNWEGMDTSSGEDTKEGNTQRVRITLDNTLWPKWQRWIELVMQHTGSSNDYKAFTEALHCLERYGERYLKELGSDA